MSAYKHGSEGPSETREGVDVRSRADSFHLTLSDVIHLLFKRRLPTVQFQHLTHTHTDANL